METTRNASLKFIHPVIQLYSGAKIEKSHALVACLFLPLNLVITP